MSSKRRSRKVTVENDKIALGDISSSEKRKLSVFERLGPGAPRKYDVAEKHSTADTEPSPGICHKWQKYGTCQYGGKCRYQHGPRREHSPEEYHHHHGDKDSDSDSELNSKSSSRDSKKDKIKSTVVVTKPTTLDESESDPGPDCTDEDLQRRLSQLKQELSRLDQEEKERERIERAGLAQISSDESEKDIPPVITPPTKHKKEKGPGEQTKKKKEKKKKKKKLQKMLPEGDEEKTEKKTHHTPLEKDVLKAKQKTLEKPKASEKPKLAEKKKAGPMIPRSVQQKVIKTRQSSSSPSKSPSSSPSVVKKKKLSPKQMKREKMPAVEKHGDEGVKADGTGQGERGLRETQHRSYSPSYRSDLKKEKPSEKASRSHRELSPRSEVRDRSGERMVRSHRDISPRMDVKDKSGGRISRSHREASPVLVSRHRDPDRESSRSISGRHHGRSVTPQSRHSQSDNHWSRKTASRHTSSSSSSSSSDSSSSSSPSPVRSRRTPSPRRQYASPHRPSLGKRTEARSNSLSRHGKSQHIYGKGSRKGKDIERSPSRKRDTVERIMHSRDRSVPLDISKKHQLSEHELRKMDDLSRRHESSQRDSHWREASVDKLRRRRSPEDERKQAIISEPRRDQPEAMDRSDRRKLDQTQSSRQRSSRDASDKRVHSTKLHDEYAAEYDTRTRSVESSARALSPTDRHRTDYTQYREAYATERDRYAERDRYDIYARDAHDVYIRSDDRSRDVDRERDYVSSTVIDPRDRDRYERESSYSHSHYASYVRDTDRLDVRRDYSAYYDERGHLIEDTSRLRTEDLRGRSADDRSREDYSRSYDRYRYHYAYNTAEYETSSRSDLDRRRDSSRDVSSDRTRSRDWQLERARWDRDRLRDDPRLLDPEVARSVHDPRDLVDPRDLIRDHTRDSRDVRVDSRSDVHADLRIKVHSDVRTDPMIDSHVDVRSDSRVDVRADSRVDVRSDSHVDLRADPRGDIRDVHITSRSRDRSIDNRESRGRTDRDRLLEVECKDLSRDHLSRRSQWEQTDRSWSGDKSKDRLAAGSRKRARGEAEPAAKSPSSKHRREGSLEKDFAKLDKRTIEQEPHKASSSRSKVSDCSHDARLDQKQSQERKPKEAEILYSDKTRGEKDYDRDVERREKKYEKAHPKHGKESMDGEKVEHDSRSTSSRDADSKESRDSRSKERDSHATDPEQERLYEHRSWTSKERELDVERERQNRTKLRKAYDKEKEDSAVTSSSLSSSHHVDYKRRRSHSVDSPRKRPRKKVRDGDAVSDWSNPDKDITDTDLQYKHTTSQVADERFGHSPSHSSLGSKHSIPEDDRVEHRDDRLLYDYDRSVHVRDDLLDQERSARTDTKYLYLDKEREVSRTRSVDRTLAGHYADRRDETEVRDEYSRDVDLHKSDPRQVEMYARDWPNPDRIDDVDRRSRDRDRGMDRVLDQVEREHISDVPREHSVDRADWSTVYRDHRTDSYMESSHGYHSDRVYPDTRVDSYTRDSNRLVVDHRSTADIDPVLDRRDSPLEHPDPHIDLKPIDRGYYESQDSKRDRYAETWSAAYPTTTTSTPQSQTDPTLVTLPPGETSSVQPTEEKADGETIEYDAISDDDLDDIIGPDQSSDTEEQKPQKTGIIDVLDIDWSSLMKHNVPKSVTSGSALKRFTPASIFKKIGVSLQFAGEKLYTKIENICEKQNEGNEFTEPAGDTEQISGDVKVEDPSQAVKTEADTEKQDAIKPEDIKPDVTKLDVVQPDMAQPDVKPDEMKVEEMTTDVKPDVTNLGAVKPEDSKADVLRPDESKPDATKPEAVKPGATKTDIAKPDPKKPSVTKADAAKFKLLHSIAQFHVSLSAKRRERDELLKDVGPYRRALCARRDLYMRKKLCKLDLECDSLHLYPAQVVDQELYRQSVQIFHAEKSQPITAGLNTKPTAEPEIAAS